MNAFCEKLGGLFVVVLSVGLIAATLLLIHDGKCPADVGLGFITASLLPVAMSRQHHRKYRALQEQIAATRSDVRTIVAAHAHDLRQHVTETTKATSQKLDDLAASRELAKPAAARTNPRNKKQC